MENERSMNELIKARRRKDNPNTFYVYAHLRALDGVVFYIGKGCASRAWNYQSRSGYWRNTAEKYGCIVKILHFNLSEDCAFQLEENLIKSLRNNGVKLVNLDGGGRGRAVSPATRHKQSLAHAKRAKPWAINNLKLYMESRFPVPIHENPAADHTVYTFLNTVTLDKIVGTRYEFSEQSGVSMTSIKGLFSSLRKHRTVNGWCRLFDGESESDAVVRATICKPAINECTYVFVNGNERFVGTKNGLACKYNLNVKSLQRLFGAKPKTAVKGWQIEKEVINE
jgi:hypothetical protein